MQKQKTKKKVKEKTYLNIFQRPFSSLCIKYFFYEGFAHTMNDENDSGNL